jgi:para-aminobenzoate synthetase/4-amino-4-deoxychorismate lyase
MCRILLDFHDPSGAPASAAFRRPAGVVSATTLGEVVPALRRVEAATRDGAHAVGWITYEAAPAFDRAMRVHAGTLRMPRVWFALFDSAGVAGSAGGEEPTADPGSRPGSTGAPPGGWRLNTDARHHARSVAAVRAAIAEGRTYQTNLTARFEASAPPDPRRLWDGMRRAQGRGLHAYLDTGRFAVASASPELFFRTRGREIVTRPMKGTRRRGRWAEEDAALEAALRTSAKDRAENLMIVDLLRNDLGRVCETGSVAVPRLADVERFRTVWQMTSTVTGRLRTDAGLVDVLAALFPCGSVTGAPKISTMGIIADLETSPREVYCGAIGWVRPGGDAVFSVPIRTVWIDRDRDAATYGAGGGIVWDSTPAAELDELRAKAVVVREPWPELALLETMALVDGRLVRRDRHLARMRASAGRLDFPFDPEPIDGILDGLTAERPAGAWRVRLTLDARGAPATEVGPLDWRGAEAPGPPPDPASLPTVALAREPVDASDLFLYHKTTHREVYDRRRADAPADVLDVLLFNRRGEVTEFCRGNVVVELDGRRLTPPVESGLLPGCFRAELLEAGGAEEAVVPVAALADARRIWLVNSVRGWVEVRLARAGTPPPAP